MKKALLLLTLAVVSTAPVSADPNIFGETGLVSIPTARTLDYREVHLHGHRGHDFESYGIGFGVVKNLELSGTQMEVEPGNPLGLTPRTVTRDGVTEIKARPVSVVNAKYRVLRERLVVPAVAVGFTDAFDQFDEGPSFYAVASKQLVIPTPLRKWSVSAHAGIGTGIYGFEPFAGAEVGLGFPFTLFTFGLPVTAMAEYANQEISGGARVGLPFGFAAEAGVIRGSSVYGSVSFRRKF